MYNNIYISAKKWKNKQIKQLFDLRDEMVYHNIDEKLIKEYLDDEYEKINNQYKIRIYKSKNKKSEISKIVYNKILYEMKSNNKTDNIDFID
jgi:hypothetical protein